MVTTRGLKLPNVVQSENMMKETSKHIPVLLDKVVEILDPNPGETYFDGTAGFGGHAQAIKSKIGEGRMILVDRDQHAVKELEGRFGKQAEIWPIDYASAVSNLTEQGRKVDMVLLDLGVSSPQLDVADRGFSFNNDGPLDMRMDQNQIETAADIINNTKENELANIIYRYGEERKSRRVAKAIVENRPLETTKQLADVVSKVVGRSGDIHPATRTFQAIRIYLNEELDQLEKSLPSIVEILNPGGRLVIISFHSLEDRIVKDFLNKESRDCICPPEQPVCNCNHQATLKKITKKPISGQEDAFNPRARSAKLRAAVKLNKK